MSDLTILIIDMLNDFFEKPPLKTEKKELVEAINKLVYLGRKNNASVIWIKQEFAPDLSDAFLEMRKKNIAITISDTAGSQFLSELERHDQDHVIVKKRYSAFFGTGLEQLLQSLNSSCLVIAGINTHACVRMTAIDAYQRDYEVILAEDCISSNDKEHHDISLKYMNGKIAQVLKSSQIFK